MMPSPHPLYERERIFNKRGPAAPPSLGVCFSGGGNRSAAFAIGVLRALHDLRLLPSIDVISAVSGGSYALSWFLLQPFYHRASSRDPRTALSGIQDQMLDVDGPFQQYLVNNAKPFGVTGWVGLAGQVALMLPFDLALFNTLRLLMVPLTRGRGARRTANLLNAVSLARRSYREGIQHTYQLVPNAADRTPMQPMSAWKRGFIASEHLDLTLSDVEPVSFPALRDFAQRAGLPSFVFNATVSPPAPDANGALSERIFELGPMGFGANSCGYLSWEETDAQGWEPSADVPDDWWKQALKETARDPDRYGLASPYAVLRNFNVASAISGAALSGTNIEPRRMRWLLRLLNMGLEYVVPSPADRRSVLRLSDGGHSENLGAYVLLRRRCRTLLIVDAEHDPSYRFGSYQKLKQAASRELNIEINIPGIDHVVSGAATFTPETPIVEGTTSAGSERGRVFYLKLSMHADLLGDQAGVIQRYATGHAHFPQESTNDQYFQPAQFKAYRALGYAIARRLPASLSA